MSNASRDDNFTPTLILALNTNGRTIVRTCVVASSHGLCVSDGTTGTDYGPSIALKDENGVSTLLATSSVDGKTPVVVYGDSSGNLLIKST